MEKILSAIQNEMWDEALQLFLDYTNENKINEEVCVVGATILEHFGDKESTFDMIQAGLKFNLKNYELYLLLGNYHCEINQDKAYLSYENALFYAQKYGTEEDVEIIEGIIADFKKNNIVNVNELLIVLIEGEDKKYTQSCIESIDNTCLRSVYDFIILDIGNRENRTKQINKVVSDAVSDVDLCILSTDIIVTDNAIYNMRMALYEDEKVGAVSAVSNYAYYKQVPAYDKVKDFNEGIYFAQLNNIPQIYPYESKCALDTSFYIMRREIIDKIFPLDTTFSSEAFQNLDMGLRVVKSGFKNIVCWNSYIYRYVGTQSQDVELKMIENDKEKIKDKWGFSPEYYMNTRRELVEMIDHPKNSSIDVLEIGAGLGSTLARVQYLYPNAMVHGLEIVEKVADFASKYVDMRCCNIETFCFGKDEKYDYVICGDVLEHLVDPYSVVNKIREVLKPGGCIIASIPNILNADVIYELLHGNFTYQDAGILDRTHLRFFTQNEVVKLFEERGFKITRIIGSSNPAESTSAHKEFFDKLLSIEGVVDKSQFEVIQYMLCAEKVY